MIQVWEMCQILNVRCKSSLMSRVGELLSNFSLLSRVNYMLPRELWGLTVISAICDFCNLEDHLPRAGAVKFERPTITESGVKDAWHFHSTVCRMEDHGGCWPSTAASRETTESDSSHVCYTRKIRDWELTWFLKEKHVGWDLVMSAYWRIKETVSYHAC